METTPSLEIAETETPEFGRVHYFAGKRLEPFSFARQVAAQRCGVSGDSALESAVLLIFLCTLGEGVVDGRLTGLDIIDRARGDAGVSAFRARMNAWADAHKIGFGSAAAKEALAVADEIWLDISRSQSEPDLPPASGDEPPNV